MGDLDSEILRRSGIAFSNCMICEAVTPTAGGISLSIQIGEATEARHLCPDCAWHLRQIEEDPIRVMVADIRLALNDMPAVGKLL